MRQRRGSRGRAAACGQHRGQPRGQPQGSWACSKTWLSKTQLCRCRGQCGLSQRACARCCRPPFPGPRALWVPGTQKHFTVPCQDPADSRAQTSTHAGLCGCPPCPSCSLFRVAPGCGEGTAPAGGPSCGSQWAAQRRRERMQSAGSPGSQAQDKAHLMGTGPGGAGQGEGVCLGAEPSVWRSAVRHTGQRRGHCRPG